MEISKMTTDLWNLFVKDYENEENFYSNVTYRVWHELDYNLSENQQKSLVETLISLNEQANYEEESKLELVSHLHACLENIK